MWDSVLLAYADRGHVVPAEYRQLVTRRNGDVLPTLLVDGYVCGVWRPVEAGIEAATSSIRCPTRAWHDLAARGPEPPGAPGRPRARARTAAGFGRWWPTLPPGESRLAALLTDMSS